MNTRRTLAPLAAVALLAMAPNANCPGGGPTIVQEVVSIPGVVEPHTPGSGAPEELPPRQRSRRCSARLWI